MREGKNIFGYMYCSFMDNLILSGITDIESDLD